MKAIKEYLELSAAMHRHLCPRQVLGVRLGMLAGSVLGLVLPREDKRMLVIAETDGCAVDGISVVTNCTVGHRTMRIEDYGKIAATFIDTEANRSCRIAPAHDIRTLAFRYAPEGSSTWEAHLLGYQEMPDAELLRVEEVRLVAPLEKIISRAGRKAICRSCGEEVNNEREVLVGGNTLCLPCANGGYYLRIDAPASDQLPGEPVPAYHSRA